MIAGIILAAGHSRRMGTPKPLLRVGKQSFLEHAVWALREGGCEEVLVVVGPAENPDARRIAEAAERAGARTVQNPLEDSEQIDSLRSALCALDDAATAAVVTPVDFPRIGSKAIRALIEAFGRTAAPVVLPTYNGEHGHPTLFARGVWAELLGDPLPEGARSVVHAHAAELVAVPVDDPGILADVNTPAEYRQIVER